MFDLPTLATRRLLSLSILLGITSASLLEAEDSKHPAVPVDAALKMLQEGNARFAAGKSRHLHTNKLPENQTEKVAAAVEANVRWSMKQLQGLLDDRKQVQNVGIVGAVYNLHQGKVNFLK